MALKLCLPLVSVVLLLTYMENKLRNLTFDRGQHQSDNAELVEDIFLAVSSFNGMEESYMDMRRLKSFDLVEESPETRKSVCRAVLSSPYFFDEHKVVTTNEHSGSGFWHRIKTTFSEPYAYKPYHISVHGQAFPEHAFSCTGWNRESKKSESYFISPEYHLRNTTTRFVFAYNEKQDMVIVAMAEEPAKVADSLLTPEQNFNRDYNTKIKSDAHENSVDIEYGSHVICDLSTTKRFRLCSIMLHTAEYREEVRFPYPMDRSESKCLKLKVRSKSQSGGLHEEPFHAWAVECRAMDIRNREATPFYISMGSGAGNFFVSRKVDKRIRVVNEYHVPNSLL